MHLREGMLRATITVEATAALLVASGWLLRPSTSHIGSGKIAADVAITLGWLLLVSVALEVALWMICSPAARKSVVVRACFYVAASASLFVPVFRPAL